MITNSNSSPLLAIEDKSNPNNIYQDISKEEGQWEFLNFQARRLKKGASWTHNTGENEYAIVFIEWQFFGRIG